MGRPPVVPQYMVRYSASPGAGSPMPQVRTARRRLVRVARTYSTEAPGRTCQLSRPPIMLSTRQQPNSGTIAARTWWYLAFVSTR